MDSVFTECGSIREMPDSRRQKPDNRSGETDCKKYYPDDALIEGEIAQSGRAVQVYEITIEHLSGKEIQER